MLLRPLPVWRGTSADQCERGPCPDQGEPHLRLHRRSNCSAHRTRLEHREVTLKGAQHACSPKVCHKRTCVCSENKLRTHQVCKRLDLQEGQSEFRGVCVTFCHTEFFSSVRTVPTSPSQQSRHGSILHFQLLLGSLPISLDLIEVAAFADWKARIVLNLRILSNLMLIHLWSVLGRYTLVLYTALIKGGGVKMELRVCRTMCCQRCEAAADGWGLQTGCKGQC